MNIFLKLVFLFFTGSLIGWGMETVFRRFCKDNKERKWINPGFLIGPYLPLYGFGLCILFLLTELEFFLTIESPILAKAAVILLMGICLTLLELAAGLIFIKGMKVKLWDYTDKPFNYKGIICPEFSFYWLILAVVYYIFIHPRILNLLEEFTVNLPAAFVLGSLFGIFAVDFGYSIQIAAKIRRFAAEKNILVRYEELKRNIRRHADETREKYIFIFAFKSKISLNEHLAKYLDRQQSVLKKLKDKKKK